MPGAPLNPVNPLNSPYIERITPQPIDCIRRKGNNTTSLKNLDGSVNLQS